MNSISMFNLVCVSIGEDFETSKISISFTELISGQCSYYIDNIQLIYSENQWAGT